MKLFNLTDVSTPQLKRQGLVNCPIKDVFGTVVKPGECGEVRDTPANRKYLQQFFVSRGAVALDRLPKNYKGTAGEKKASPPPPPPPSPPPKVARPPSEPEIEEASPDTQPAPESVEDKPKKKRSSRRGN